VNPRFVADRCRSDAHLFMLVLHELHHVLPGHTRLFPRATPAHNLAFDAVRGPSACSRRPLRRPSSRRRSRRSAARSTTAPRRPTRCSTGSQRASTARSLALDHVLSGRAREATVCLAHRPGDLAPRWIETALSPAEEAW
jgi:hypothetical protein